MLYGEASYYGASFAGRKTASGEVFEPRRYTAAHRTLPFGTVLRVTRLDTHAVVYVKVNDRGHCRKKWPNPRSFDGRRRDARHHIVRGVANVRADIVERGVGKPSKHPSSRH